ncbi:MAG TPA: response regulator [Terriglobales bacterium]|nr:response regulator [Terriglobales bacterium]
MADARRPTILLIDDEPLVREAIREHLELRQYQCWEAGNGVEALQILQTVTPDAIISDIAMPRMNGIEFVLRSRALGCRAPIILLTGVNDSSARALGTDAGAFFCISKPPDYNELDRLIRRSIELQRSAST